MLNRTILRPVLYITLIYWFIYFQFTDNVLLSIKLIKRENNIMKKGIILWTKCSYIKALQHKTLNTQMSILPCLHIYACWYIWQNLVRRVFTFSKLTKNLFWFGKNQSRLDLGIRLSVDISVCPFVHDHFYKINHSRTVLLFIIKLDLKLILRTVNVPL